MMAKTETCPECGDLFDPRGIKLHRKVRHGVQSPGGGFYSESSKHPSTPAPSGTDITEEEDQPIEDGDTVFKKRDGQWGFF
jgi:hypothetical protein